MAAHELEFSLGKINKAFSEEKEAEFIDLFNKKFERLIDKAFFSQKQLVIGHRLRPRLVYWGFLSTKRNKEITKEDLNILADIATSIELIHKSSIILDDLIDGDIARHGEKAFHIEYGDENTILFSLNLLSNALLTLNEVFIQKKITTSIYEKSIQLLLRTMQEMSLGCLEEQNLSNNKRFEVSKIKEIMKMETAALITNSLLLGYYASNQADIVVEKALKSIGTDCGYMFQVMNDLEPFCNRLKTIDHKGYLNNDIARSKKNLAIALLYNLANSREKKMFHRLDMLSEQSILNLYDKYNITRLMMEEIDQISKRVIDTIRGLSPQVFNSEWAIGFEIFIKSLEKICQERLA